jgi:hypothetical protein
MYRVATCIKTCVDRRKLLLPPATDIVETVLRESYTKELRKISHADNIIRGKMSDIS